MTLAEQVRQRLWEWILKGKLKPGDRLRIQELAKTLKVSDTPVREALIRLRQTGVVQSVPWVGTRIREFTRRDIEEVFDVRKALECFAVRMAAVRIAEGRLQQLKQRLLAANEALDQGEVGPSIVADNEFHAEIVRSAGNSRISTLLGNIRDQIYMFAGFGARTPEGPRESLHMHLQIVDLLLQRDTDAAVRLMEEHLEQAKQQALHGYFGTADTAHVVQARVD